MGRIFLNILSVSLSGAVIGGILIFLHPLTRKHFSKTWNYYVWLILLLRLIIPADLSLSPFRISYPVFREGVVDAAKDAETGGDGERTRGVESLGSSPDTGELGEIGKTGENSQTGEIGKTGENGQTGEIGKTGENAPAESSRSLEGSEEAEIAGTPGERAKADAWRLAIYFLGIFWVFGALTVFLTKLVRYGRQLKRIRSSCRVVTDRDTIVTADVVALRLNLEAHVSVYESPLVSGPVTMGLFNPFVVLPVENRRMGDTALIFHHELLHIKRKDLWYKWLWQLILCIHWFNPVLIKVQKILSEDCELSCDEQILKHLSDNGKRAYGNILLDTAQKNLDFGETVFLTTLLEEKKALKERLKGIIEYKKQSAFKIVLSVLAMTGIISLSACGNIIISADWEEEKGAFADAGDDEGSFWDIFKLDEDDFLYSGEFDKSGEAYKIYDHDEYIARADDNDLWRAYYYYGGDKIRCRGFCLNGSDSIYIIYAKKDTTVEISSEFKPVEGKFKIVHVAPDNSVSVLNETGDLNTAAIQLKEGRNVIKMVGQAARLKNLEVRHSTLNMDEIENVYYAPEEEYADIILSELEKGNVDKEKIMDSLVYMDEKKVSEVFKELCKQGVTLTVGEIEDIFIYGDERLTGQYLAEAIRNQEVQPVNGEMLRKIMYYMDSDVLAELVMLMEKKELTFDVLADCMICLEEEDAGRCLTYYMEIGNSLTYSQYTRISYFLDEGTRRKLESEMEYQKSLSWN